MIWLALFKETKGSLLAMRCVWWKVVRLAISMGKLLSGINDGAIVYGRDGLPQEIGSGNTVKVGNCNPAFLLGWGNSFTYKDFSYYFLIDGHFGGEVLAQTQAVLDQIGVSKVSGEARRWGM